jgi:predicted dehydrogenase
MARLRIGVVGAGRVAQVCHLPWLVRERERFEVVAVADPVPAVREEVSHHLGVPGFPDLAGMVALGLDAVVCCTPIGTHPEVVGQALDAGLHVLCEKPVALSSCDCDALIHRRDRAGRLVQVGCMKRFDPAFPRLLELAPADISDLRYLSVEVSDSLDAPFTGALNLQRPAPRDPLWDRVQRLEADQVRQAVGYELPPDAYAAYRHGFFASLVHDVNLAQAIVRAMGADQLDEPSDAAYWSGGSAVQLGVPLPGGGRANLVHLRTPGVPLYREIVSMHCRDRILELSFASPYLSRRPAELVERRADGTGRLRETRFDVGYDDAFRRQLVHFHRAVLAEVEPVNTLEEARRDLALLERAHALAVQRAGRAPVLAGNPVG